MFSKSYIEKCKMYKEQIEYTIQCTRAFANQYGVPTEVFRVSDYFHDPTCMTLAEFKQVKRVEGCSLYAKDPNKPYLINDCVLLPTGEQLRAGLLARGWKVITQDGKGPEALLDEFIHDIEEERERQRKKEEQGG